MITLPTYNWVEHSSDDDYGGGDGGDGGGMTVTAMTCLAKLPVTLSRFV